METQRIVLAYTGDAASCAAVKWLQAASRAEIAAVIVDVGQVDDLEEVRARALNCGAVRAHVVDRSDVFAREVMVAIGQGDPIDHESLARMAHPIIAATLAEIAAIEGTGTVAHASTRVTLTERIHAVNPALQVIAPASEWLNRGVDVPSYLATHRLSPGVVRAERNLLMRRPMPGARTTARVTIGFEDGVPVSVNGVAMGLKDLIECVSVISAQYTAATSVGAPALALLQTAYATCGGRDSATVELRPLTIGVVDELAADDALVNRA